MAGMGPNQASSVDRTDVDKMEEVSDADLFPYGHGVTFGD